MLKTLLTVMFVVLLLGAGSSVAMAVETVTVGDPGNVADTEDIVQGAVPYTYNISKYEISAAEYAEFLNATADTDTYGAWHSLMWSDWIYGSNHQIERTGSPGSYTYTAAAAWANRPIAPINWGDAARFANWMHNGQPTGAQDLTTTEDGAYFLNGATIDAQLLAVTREADWQWAIPTTDEWYKAAYYKGGSTNAGYWDYPTSNDTAPGRDMADPDGNNANYGGFGNPIPIEPGYYLTVGGEFQDSESPYGTFDQGGNVWEWTEGLTDSQIYAWIYGGVMDNAVTYLSAASGRTDQPRSALGVMGIRLVQVPEPASLLGDANLDGLVSADDFASVQSHFGDSGVAGGGLLGDANHDGLVSADDFASVQSNFGASLPEPATLGLLLMGALPLLRRRR